MKSVNLILMWLFNKGEHDEIFFATGTDEHGYKIQKKAKLENQDIQIM